MMILEAYVSGDTNGRLTVELSILLDYAKLGKLPAQAD